MRNLEAKELDGVNLAYAKATFSGHGHYKVFFEFRYKVYCNTLTTITNNMPIIDDWKDADDLYDKIAILSQLINTSMEEYLCEWKLEIDEKGK